MGRGKEPKKPKRTLQQPEATPSSADALAEAKHAISDLAAENERLSDRLAVEAMDASEEEKTSATGWRLPTHGQVSISESPQLR